MSKTEKIKKSEIFFQLVSLSEVAQMLGISVRSCQRLSSQDRLPRPFRICGMERWSRQEIEAWVLTRRENDGNFTEEVEAAGGK